MVAGSIKVVQILPDLESGGVERGTLEVGKYLADHGNDSIVISGGGRLVAQLEREGSTHLTWRHIGEKSPRCLRYIFQLRKYPCGSKGGYPSYQIPASSLGRISCLEKPS